MTVVKTDDNARKTCSADAVLHLEHFKAFIFDLDGVITQTAKIHAVAWKKMFDDYLAKHTPHGKAYTPFDIESDYLRYVDGKPRYDGVRSFLQSRDVALPYGDPGDAPGKETVCGLGNLKDDLYHATLRSDGVEVYQSSIQLLRLLRDAGIRTAVVSSSRNCLDVLKAADIVELFDARVDGIELERLQMPGKPAPDMFIEASRRLDASPQRCVGVEDATSGVAALRAAGFGCVVGVNRANQTNALYEHGADVVVDDLAELKLVEVNQASGKAKTASVSALPDALERFDEIAPPDERKPAVFLDYDGTLTPIVSRPQDAVLSNAMRATLQRLATLCTVAIVSGRDLADVRNLVALKDLWYAGSHGFDIAGPNGERTEHQEGRRYLAELDAAEQDLLDALANVRGCLVERKRFSIATHYRLVAPDEVESVTQTARNIHKHHSGLRLKGGKKVLELQPDVDWHKGKALRWLMRVQQLDAAHFVPLYIGDDVTDEDAFRELADDGVGILVAQENGVTRAAYRLDDPGAVQDFLNRLADKLLKPQS
ncbi:MAG: trehalose-phosphatase [Betaproteobacteria bacterium]|nr:MAG: trehalose-phosphatase [Betaproteobacteria bacterium]